MTEIGFVLAGGVGRRMGGTRPKVLYQVENKAMVVRALDALRDSGVGALVAVLSHRSDETAAALPPDVDVVVQDRPRGTASAMIAAQHWFEDDGDAVIVGFGDMPWLNPRSARRLLDAIADGADAAVLTYRFEDPPHFGRVVRESDGRFVRIVEFKDCTPEQRAIDELNAGLFAFRAGALRRALGQIDADNAQGELYLTDVPGAIAADGGRVVTVEAEFAEEALGVNDPRHLRFARLLPLLKDSERRLWLANAIVGGFLRRATGGD